MKLPILLGKQKNGEALIVDLTQLPHLLIGGVSGSGKSNLIITMIDGLASAKSPEEVKFLLIDTKIVEFNGLAQRVKDYLYQPVEADSGEAYYDCMESFKAISELRKELERRENLFIGNYRNIEDYNADNEDKLPYIVLVIDEYAELMLMTSQYKDFQYDLDDDCWKDDDDSMFEDPDTFITDLLCLCNKGRALGIHVIISTLRPSRDIVIGSLKGLIPSRIAFKVSNEKDSYTILDRMGAEQLESPGDMIWSHRGNYILAHGPLCVDYQDRLCH